MVTVIMIILIGIVGALWALAIIYLLALIAILVKIIFKSVIWFMEITLERLSDFADKVGRR